MKRITKVTALGLAPIAFGALTAGAQQATPTTDPPTFKGVIKLDARESTPEGRQKNRRIEIMIIEKSLADEMARQGT